MATTTSLSSAATNYTLLLVVYAIGSGYYSTIAVKSNTTALKVTTAESGYYQTTYQRDITISNSNFVTSTGTYARTSRSEYGNFDAITIKSIYGIK